MPSLNSYSQFETLKVLQHVVEYGYDTESLARLPTTLKQEDGIEYDEEDVTSKFSPGALQNLLSETTSQNQTLQPRKGSGTGPSTNGLLHDSKSTNVIQPVGNGMQAGSADYAVIADQLYHEFRRVTIKALREQELEYRRLQGEITKLEDESSKQTAQVAYEARILNSSPQLNASITNPARTADPTSTQLHPNLEATTHQPSATAASSTPIPPVAHSPSSHNGVAQPPLPHVPPVYGPRSSSNTPVARQSQPLPSNGPPQPHASPRTFDRTLPAPSPQRNLFGSNAAPLPYQAPTQNGQPPILPPIRSLQRMPSYEGYPNQQRTSSTGRGSPLPQSSNQPYSPHHQYAPAPAYGWHAPPQPPYNPQPHFAGQPHYQPPPPPHIGRYPPQTQSPQLLSYPQYPNTVPVPYANPQQWRPQINETPRHTVSASTTPIPRPSSRASTKSQPSTPWRVRKSVGGRLRSPSRPVIEVIPAIELKAPPAPELAPPRKQSLLPKSEETLSNVGPDASPAPAELRRSQSVLSSVSEKQEPPRRRPGRPPKLKVEPLSTPLPSTPDTEQKSSGRKGRGRSGTLTQVLELPRAHTVAKRKRENLSTTPAFENENSTVQHDTSTYYSDPDFVVVSRTFAKTCGLVLTEIQSHKLGGIFTKALSERDAPGYKDLVKQPQNFNSIRTAISKGGRAAVTAIDEFEARDSANEVELSKEKHIGNGFYLLRRTEDLIPPKGIVNSAQLHTELVRIFANAVLFSPLPSSERGLGRALKLRKKGGRALRDGEVRRSRRLQREESEGKEDQSRGSSHVSTTISTGTAESSDLSSAEERGIITDAREMYEEVERAVTSWREHEEENMAAGMAAVANVERDRDRERLGSITASSANDFEMDGSVVELGDRQDTPTAGARKRRKLNEHH